MKTSAEISWVTLKSLATGDILTHPPEPGTSGKEAHPGSSHNGGWGSGMKQVIYDEILVEAMSQFGTPSDLHCLYLNGVREWTLALSPISFSRNHLQFIPLENSDFYSLLCAWCMHSYVRDCRQVGATYTYGSHRTTWIVSLSLLPCRWGPFVLWLLYAAGQLAWGFWGFLQSPRRGTGLIDVHTVCCTFIHCIVFLWLW